MVPALLDVVPLWFLVSLAVNVFFGVWLLLSASHKAYTFAPKVLKALVDDALSAAYNTPAPDAQEVLKTLRALRRLPTPQYLDEATKSAESIDSTPKTVNTPPLSPPPSPTDKDRLSAIKSAPIGPALPRVFASVPNPYAGLPMMELLAQIPGAPDAPLSPFKRYAPQEFRLSRSLPDVLGILVNERARRLEPPAPFTPHRQGASIEELLGGLSDAPTAKHASEPAPTSRLPEPAPTSRLPNMPP
ncbi:hypothetical protein BC940DRAFT_320122 [Gongronella butleri]|nr:hypothetical protein BC940DRAFT_320122 [Gongronella butleri]